MIETIIPICQNLALVEMCNDENELCEFLKPFIREHRRDYTTILALGDIATIEFELGTVWLRSNRDTINSMGVSCIKRFTASKIESIASWFAFTLCNGMHEIPYRPDLKTLDYDL